MKRIALLWKLAWDDLGVLWFALRQPDRPGWLAPGIALVALYALAPFNVAIPFVGIVDDGMLVPLVLHLMARCLPAHLRRHTRGEWSAR